MGNFVIDIFNWIIKAFGTVLSWLIGLLPNSPFTSVNNSNVSQYLGGLAWVIPFPQIIAMLEAWTAAIVIYYVYSVIMRWIKVIA